MELVLLPLMILKVAYLATKHLIEQGCKRIAHLTGDQSLRNI